MGEDDERCGAGGVTSSACARREEERNEARQQCATLQGEVRALEASSAAEKAVREERATLRAAIDAAEARAAIALNQAASIGQDRTRLDARSLLRLAMEVAAESAVKREHELRAESAAQLAAAEQIARQMAEAP